MIALRKSDSRDDLIRPNQHSPDRGTAFGVRPFSADSYGRSTQSIRGTDDETHLYRVVVIIAQPYRSCQQPVGIFSPNGGFF